MKGKQLELFSVDDMYGCISVEDEIEAIHISAYLWAIRIVSDFDDEMFYRVKKECDAVKIGEGEYYVPSIPGSLNIYKLAALRDCLDMREQALIGEKYVHHLPQSCNRPHVTYPHAFVLARKAFKENYYEDFRERGWWITDLDMRQLIGLDLYETSLSIMQGYRRET